MALEPGPATYFDLPTITPEAEPPLTVEDFNPSTEELAGVEQDLASQAAALGSAKDELYTTTFNLYAQLNVVEKELGGEGGVPPAIRPDDVQEGLNDTDAAIDDAIAACPDIVEAPPPGVPLQPPREPEINDGNLPL